MRLFFTFFTFAALLGCVTPKPVVPALAGKPRVKINEQAQSSNVSEPLSPPKAEASAPANTDKKGSQKNVRKKTKGGESIN